MMPCLELGYDKSDEVLNNWDQLNPGALVIVKDNTCGHNYIMGMVYAVDDVVDRSSATLSLRDIFSGERGNRITVKNLCLAKQVKKVPETPPPDADALFKRCAMPQGHRDAIQQALSQENAGKREKLFKTWGFGDTLEKGKGLIFLFHGEPGTGKTMCAQAIAELLGKKYVLIGAAELQSAVPGQTERNIKETFKKAKSGKLVIIFDECDSVLYNRNHVGAILGAEINCLLSEIEAFEGVCILTTNRSVLLDPALERRIALKLEFQRPDQETRKVIWRALIPEKCPLHNNVCFDKLSEYDLPGGNIKNAILTAARKAVHENKDFIFMEDFTEAAEREVAGQRAFKRNSKVHPSMPRFQPQQELDFATGIHRDLFRARDRVDLGKEPENGKAES